MTKDDAENPIPLNDEIEGDRDSTGDFVFVRVGASVPIKPSNSAFDLRSPPSQPISISQRHRLIFLAHAEGFFVARTGDVIGIANEIKEKAKEIKEKGEGPSVEEASLLDVKAGRVSILSVSRDESILAAAVDHNIFFYSIISLLNKEQEPSFLCSLNESGFVKDLKWQKNMGKSFVVLSSHGSMYQGMLKAELKNVMNNVDAVDWSAEGSFVAVARKGIITIFSSNFKEILSMSLFFESWRPIDSEHTVKVDTIKWLRDDSIIIGCLQVNEDGEEEGYLVQVIKSKGHNFSEISCNPVVYSFPDLFDAVWDSLPIGRGPYLLANYLDYWEVVLASNQKAIDQHILLFKWSIEDHRREVVSLEFRSDKYTPKIEVPENGDDNLLLGFCVEKFSLNEKIKIQVDDKFKEISPRCTLFCLTSEGKLNLFHAARITDCLDPLQTFVATDSSNIVKEKSFTSSLPEASTTNPILKDDDIKDTSSGNQLKQISTRAVDAQQDVFQPQSLAPQRKQVGDVSRVGLFTGQFGDSKSSKEAPSIQGSGFVVKNDVTAGLKVLPDFSAERVESTSLVGKTAEAPAATCGSPVAVANEVFGSNGTGGAPFALQSTGKLFGANINPSTPTFSKSLLGESQERTKFISFATESQSSAQLFSSKYSNIEPQSSIFSSSKATQSKGYSSSLPSTGKAEMLHTFPGSQTFAQENSLGGKSNYSKVQQLLESTRTSKYPQTLDSESEISKQFYNVKIMAHELDILLSFIEKKGGFRDACTVYQRSSLLALENVLGDLSEISYKCKKDVEERLMEIQQLQNKMLQVSARQVYMKGIVEQASNKKYWDIWNQQKLNPELEAKRQNILNANQTLTNQIIELERHFNTLEINRFGESGRTSLGHTAFQSGLVPARQRQSLQSVYNTLNSQLAAAEQLSECLSKQLSELHLDSAPVNHHSIAKELFESIGLSDEIMSIQSPVCKMPGLVPDSTRRVHPSTSNAIKEHLRKKTSSVTMAFEPESARRRKDSLDRNRTTFEPPKTTVKRSMQVQRYIGGANKPFQKAKEIFDSQMEAFSVQQKSNATSGSSSLQYILNEGMQESRLKLSIEAQPNSGAKWAKDIASQPSLFESKSHIEVGTRKTSNPPLSMSSSLSRVSSSQSTTKEPFSSSDTPSSEVTEVGYLSKPLAANTSSRYTSSTLSSPISPLNTKLVVEGKDQPGKNSNLASRGTAPALSFPASIKHLVESSESVSSGTNESNSSTLSSVSAFASAGKTTKFNKTATGNQSSEFILDDSSNPKVSVPTSSSLSLPFSTFATPAMASTKPFLTPASTDPSSFGKSLPSTKPAGVTNEEVSVSTSVMANIQSLSSSSLILTHSKNSAIQTTTAPNSKPVVSSFDTKSLASNQGALESTPASGPSIHSLSSSRTLFSQSQESFAKSSITALKTPTVTEPTPPVTSGPVHFDKANSKSQPTTSQSSASESMPKSEDNLIPTSNNSTSHTVSLVRPEMPSSTAQVSTTAEKDERLDASLSQEDEMEEEAPDTSTALSLGSLGGFGLGSTPSSAPKSNPFGSSFPTANSSTASPPLTLTPSAGEPFRPASFSLPSAQIVQTSQPGTSGGFSSSLGGGFGAFGQPVHVGVGQQALGSVLGSFGQSRQLGSGMPCVGMPSVGFPSSSAFSGGGFSPAANSGGFAAAGGFAGAAAGGFAGAAAGGGFASAASAGGGFAAAAAKGGGFAPLASGGGFAGAAGGGGFGTVAPTSGFATADTAIGGFGGAGTSGGFASGGFGAFGSNQGGGFSAFGGNSAAGTGKPPAQLLTQMRK